MTASTILFFIALACMIVVVAALIMGVAGMTSTDGDAAQKSNKLMQMRVLFQGLALLFLFLAYVAK